jgi:hypothetical protein
MRSATPSTLTLLNASSEIFASRLQGKAGQSARQLSIEQFEVTGQREARSYFGKRRSQRDSPAIANRQPHHPQ